MENFVRENERRLIMAIIQRNENRIRECTKIRDQIGRTLYFLDIDNDRDIYKDSIKFLSKALVNIERTLDDLCLMEDAFNGPARDVRYKQKKYK